MSKKDGEYFHSNSLQHVFNGAYDQKNRALRVAITKDPPFVPSDILANVNPLEIVAADFPYPSNPYPLAVLRAVDNDINDEHSFKIIDDKSGLFVILENPTNKNQPILAVADTVDALPIGSIFDVTIRVVDNFGLITKKTFNIPLVATASPLAGPTDIVFSEISVPDKSIAGTLVASLSTIGGLAAFTYTKIADPDNKFSVVGSEIVLSSTVNRSGDIRHNVTIRSTDTNGSYIDKEMSISVTHVETPINVEVTGGELVSVTDYDTIDITYPTVTQELYSYKLLTVTVKTVTIDYVDSSKDEILKVFYS